MKTCVLGETLLCNSNFLNCRQHLFPATKAFVPKTGGPEVERVSIISTDASRGLSKKIQSCDLVWK